MDMSGEYRIEAPIQTVWAAIQNPDILRATIPGCEELDKTSDTEMSAKVALKIGPVKAKFSGTVELQDLMPPNSLKIQGEGKGGIAGFAKGGAVVNLVASEGGTELSYEVEAKVGGKIAQLGSRLIDGVANKMADQFFSRFKEVVEDGSTATVSPPASHDPGEPDMGIVDMCRDTDLMIYDATYTDAEFPDFWNFGHSTWEEGVRLAKAAGANENANPHNTPTLKNFDKPFLQNIFCGRTCIH